MVVLLVLQFLILFLCVQKSFFGCKQLRKDADANALFDLMELEADDVAVYWGGDGFRRQVQKILTLAEAAEQRLLPDEHVVVLVDETSDPEAITQPTDYPRAGHASNSAGTSSMPETRHCETEVLLHEEQRNKLQEYLLMHRQRVEECCKAYRNGRSVCLRSHELQPREPSTILLCCLCGGQRPSYFCMTCDECSWDACKECMEHLRDNVARLEEHALQLQRAEDSLRDRFLSCFYPEEPLHLVSLIAVMAAVEPSDQKLAICLESVQVMQILHEMPLPNARHSRILNEAALGMRNRQHADMLLKVSNSLAPKSAMPDAAIPELSESMCHCATRPRCRCVSIRRLVRLLSVAVAIAVGVAIAVAVLPLRTIPSADSTRLYQQTPGTIQYADELCWRWQPHVVVVYSMLCRHIASLRSFPNIRLLLLLVWADSLSQPCGCGHTRMAGLPICPPPAKDQTK